MIFFRKGVKGQDKKGKDIMYDLESKINFAVFPGAQVCLPPGCSHSVSCLPADGRLPLTCIKQSRQYVAWA